MNKEKQYASDFEALPQETIVQPPVKKEKDPVLSFLGAQSALCCLALVVVLVLRLVGGEWYQTVKQGYVRRFCDVTSPTEVLDVFSGSTSQPETPDTVATMAAVTPTSVSVSAEPYGDWTDDSLALTKEPQLLSTAVGSSLGNRMQVPVQGQVTSSFGYRIHPIYGTRLFHNGVDIGAEEGTSIVAALEGVVETAEYNDSYGYYMIINHGGDFCTVYAHCSQLLVQKGQSVSQGESIGLVGSTGVSTGPHLHFEVRRGDYRINPEWLVDLE